MPKKVYQIISNNKTKMCISQTKILLLCHFIHIRIKIKSFSVRSNCSKYAKGIVANCKYIHESKTAYIVSLLEQLQKRLVKVSSTENASAQEKQESMPESQTQKTHETDSIVPKVSVSSQNKGHDDLPENSMSIPTKTSNKIDEAKPNTSQTFMETSTVDQELIEQSIAKNKREAEEKLIKQRMEAEKGT